MEVRAVNGYTASFKRIAAQVANREGVGMVTFIGERGLNEFLIDQSENTDVADIAAKALLAFCVEAGPRPTPGVGLAATRGGGYHHVAWLGAELET